MPNTMTDTEKKAYEAGQANESCCQRESIERLKAERDEARKDLIKNLQTTGGMPWREWSAECAKETLRADENLERAKKAEAEVERLRGQLIRAVEIAEVFESELDEYHSVDRNCPDAAWHYPYGWERSDEAKDKLEALNKEIK